MLKQLTPVEGGKAVVIDLPLLAIIGAENATELDLTTDGERLILSKQRGARHVVSASMPPSSPEQRSAFDREDPEVALQLLEEMQKLGFTSNHFKELHHFGPKASLEQHIKYCKGTRRFSAETNRIVSDRLNFCLEQRNLETPWDAAIKAACEAYPFEFQTSTNKKDDAMLNNHTVNDPSLPSKGVETMPLLTDDLLVAIVTKLATPSQPLVEATTIIAYCEQNAIDIQGGGTAKYAAFWSADLGEAKGDHRLQKFKRSPTAQARNAWSLTSNLDQARSWAASNGWLLVPWSTAEENWMFKFSGPSATTSPFFKGKP